MNRKQIALSGLFCYFVLFILAAIFYKERTAFNDAAFHLFHITKEHSFAFQNNRFGAFFTQSAPVLASRFGASLHTIMIVYSLVFILFHCLLFLCCVYLIKDKFFSTCILLFSFFMTAHSFFWILSELVQGIVLLLLFFAAYHNYKTRIFQTISGKLLASLCILLLVFFHPLLIVPLTFLSLYCAVHLKVQKEELKYLIYFFMLYFIGTVIKSTVFKTTGYETSAFGGLKNFITFFPDYFTISSHKVFFHNCLRIYYFLLVALIFLVFHYLRNSDILKLLLVVLSFTGYLLIVNVCYPTGAPAFYMENLYMPLSVIVLIPLVFDILPSFRKSFQSVAIFLIIGSGIIRIIYTANTYSSRLAWEEDYLSKNENKKLFVDARAVPIDTLITAWGTPYEFWLLSTSQTGKSASIYIVEDSINNFFYLLPENKTAFLTFDRYYYADLNDGKYFNFQDTSRYKIITAD